MAGVELCGTCAVCCYGEQYRAALVAHWLGYCSCAGLPCSTRSRLMVPVSGNNVTHVVAVYW